ncbi:OmpH family outer membrane protein [Sandarakinorhabdus sp. AAP62]|uniref:OmpH family outer membrane protein n=1 Tax=Sandarakinorhabdus sp. AAP62 TaxID=1248916 RepID=UPI0002F131DC|nr:OmpH family outer membrane protein [Sandarakinorhabdus sp. AAP62]
MKKILIALALAGVATPVLAQQLPAAVIVTVDRQEMIATSAAAKAAQAELKPKADALNARLNQLRTSLSAEEKTLRDTQPQQGALPAAIQAWQTKARDFENRRVQADQELQRRQQEIQQAEQWVVKQINDGAQPIISQIMREKGANIAVDEQVTIQHAAAIDVTADVVARLDKALPKVSITPPAPPAGAAPAAPAPAAPAAPPRR